MEFNSTPGIHEPKKPSLNGLSVLVNPDRPNLDIVFIHGFTGHPERTWTHKGEVPNDQSVHHDDDGERPAKYRKLLSPLSFHSKSGVRKPVYWPQDLVPIAIPNARVLTYGYDTHIRHLSGHPINKSTVYDHAWNFLLDLEIQRRREPSRPLLFVAHSLGGIIVKEALRRSRGCNVNHKHLHSIYGSTSGIIFFGTPHGGADPRGLIQHIVEKCARAAGFSVNGQVINTLLPSSERLRELREEFNPMARDRGWVIHSFQEQYGLQGLNGNKVVEDTASCLNDSTAEITQHIACNHIEMCRFSGPDDVEYRKVVGALRRVLGATMKSVPLVVRPVLNAEQRNIYLDSLRFDQIDARHATIKTAHAKTCSWLLSKSEYLDWRNVNKTSDHHGFLWIKGKPAAGKSTIMKYVFTHVKKITTDGIIISFFFHARGEDLEKSAIGMYRSLLFQLLEKVPELQYLFDSLGFAAPEKGDFPRWDIETVKSLLGHAIDQLGQRCLTCFIDALDECEEDQVREMVAFFEQLGRLAATSEFRLLVCFSSRHYPHITIEKGIELILDGQEGHKQDIANYLQSQLKIGRSKLIEQMKAEILERASGIFLWVVLVVKMLNKEYDGGRIHALRKRLDEIPNGLDELFQDILTRDGQNMEELILCLQLILYAKRPLKYEELYYAILAGVAPETLSAWNSEEITIQDMGRFVLGSSKGLAEVTKSKAQYVQFIHESVRDYLLKGSGLSRLRSDFGSNSQGLSHERLKQCCQNYMRIDVSKHLPLSSPLPAASSNQAAELRLLASEKFPFLEYAVRNVLHHADAAHGYDIYQDAFVESFPVTDWNTLGNLIERYETRRHTSDASLLYILVKQNLPNLIRIELKRVPKAVMNNQTKKIRTPLSWAAEKGQEAVVKLLLEDNRVDADSMDVKSGRTPLWWAAKNGHKAVVRLLLATDKVNPDAKDNYGRTPLLGAAHDGHEAVVRLLLASDKVNLDAKDNDGETLLSWAARNGHETVVQLLLATDKVNLDAKDNYSRTPLSWAVRNGREAVVQLLLATDKVNPDAKDHDGWTPLSWAARYGYEAVVRLLLATDKVDPDAKDNNDETPLWWAAQKGHEAVVRLLLATDKVDPDAKDNDGWTPLWWAAQKGHEAVVRLLLATDMVDPDAKDKHDWTPLWRAARYGHEAVVRLLLATDKVDPDAKDNDGWTPLWWAAYNGHEAVVWLLLATNKVDPDAKDNYGRTPLLGAVREGNEAVVRLLLATDKVDPDAKDYDGQTPLWWAARDGHEPVVRLLLSTNKVDLEAKDNYGQTPLFWATRNGHEAVVKLLQPKEDFSL